MRRIIALVLAGACWVCVSATPVAAASGQGTLVVGHCSTDWSWTSYYMGLSVARITYRGNPDPYTQCGSITAQIKFVRNTSSSTPITISKTAQITDLHKYTEAVAYDNGPTICLQATFTNFIVYGASMTKVVSC
jgi:hypothetical protein